MARVAGFVPDDVRGTATGWWRLARREVDRRRLAAAHQRAVRAHERAVRAARRWTARYTCAAAVALVAVPFTSGWSELAWGVTSGVFATGAGLSAKEAGRRRRLSPPAAPQLPASLPAPPPLGSAAWPALHRIDAATGSLRRLRATSPYEVKAALEPAVSAATAVEDAARRQAWRLAEAEAALGGRREPRGVTGDPHATDPITEIAAATIELEQAAAAVEDLLDSARCLADTSGPGSASGLRAATDDALARAYGLRAAAGIGWHTADRRADR